MQCLRPRSWSPALAAPATRTEVGDIAFSFNHDARHDLNRLARIVSAGGLSGEHDSVGAIKDGVGDVAGFGARGTRAVSYTHLRAHETRHDIVCRLLLE